MEALNHALRGIPEDRIRLHTCYGLNHGPRLNDIPLAEVAPVMLRINAGAYSFEVANPRHQHEWRIWADLKLPDGKILLPGLLGHATNYVEHPELIADGICQYASLVGRENVIASADCGFSSRASFAPEVHPTVVWAKFAALAEGAAIATKRLWGGTEMAQLKDGSQLKHGHENPGRHRRPRQHRHRPAGQAAAQRARRGRLHGRRGRVRRAGPGPQARPGRLSRGPGLAAAPGPAAATGVRGHLGQGAPGQRAALPRGRDAGHRPDPGRRSGRRSARRSTCAPTWTPRTST